MLDTIHRFFNNPSARKIFLALRYPLFLAALVLLALKARIELLPAAFLVSLFGEAIQLWSFASLVKNEQLTARGPYVLVRNPMYLGRYFILLGGIMLLGNIAMAVYVLLQVSKLRTGEPVARILLREDQAERIVNSG